MKTPCPSPDDESPGRAIGRSAARDCLERTLPYLGQMDEGRPLRLADGETSLTRNVVLEIARRRGQLAWVLDSLAPKRIRNRLRRPLCWALAEMLWLDGLPSEVAASVCVDFVKRRYSGHEAAFANAVLRRATESGDPRQRFADCLAGAPPWIRHALPETLWHRWRTHYGEEKTMELAELLLRPSRLHVRVRRAYAETLAFLGPDLRVPWAPEALFRTCPDPQSLFASAAWREGCFYVQDPATLLASQMLAVRPHERIGDFCAAPGGKALALAEALGNTGGLVCLDRSSRRLRKVAENLREYPGCVIAAGDATAPPFPPASFDAILLDVPCSNTGVIRKNPDVRWRFSLQDLAALVELQARILVGTAPLVRPGGRLVYSTCSIEPEENGDNVAAFLAAHPEFERIEQRQILPAESNDGAFAALLRRKATA